MKLREFGPDVGAALFKLSRFSKYSRWALTFSTLLKLKSRTMRAHLWTKRFLNFASEFSKKKKKGNVMTENNHHCGCMQHQHVLQQSGELKWI